MKASLKKASMAHFTFCPEDVQGCLGELVGHALVMTLIDKPKGLKWPEFDRQRSRLIKALKPIVARSRRIS